MMDEVHKHNSINTKFSEFRTSK